MIISHIRYCITTWYNDSKITASKIQRIANKFIRLTFGLYHRANVTDILRNNNIITKVPSQSLLSVRGIEGCVSSGEYLNLGARGKGFQKLMFSKKEKEF